MNKTGENRNPNRDRLLSIVQNREVNRSPIPLVYFLSDYGGDSVLITNYYKTEEELRSLAKKDREEQERVEREHREKHPNLFQ